MEEEDEVRISKTQRKRESHSLQDIGEELVALGAERLAQMDLPQNLLEAVLEARRISKFGALRRQMQYLGRLMREIDPAPIRARLDAWKGQSAEATANLHKIERWRDRLLKDEGGLADFAALHPRADLQRLRALVRNAQREAAAGKPPKSFRELFQSLREILDSNAMDHGGHGEHGENQDEK
ncbi:MAG TPA: ribosome biogenesis factor YjgA [Burkholderiales bacterium]|nr:ribosome biogenesis factor YjgA [Burkholderiales bacterium]